MPIASSSSIKMIVGDFSLANANASLIIFAPSPINIYTNCGPASFRKVAFVSAAHARAIIVFPVPGGPYRRTPLGGRIPIPSKRCLCVIGRTIASLSSSIYLSSPPTSVYFSVGRSSTSIVFTKTSTKL